MDRLKYLQMENLPSAIQFTKDGDKTIAAEKLLLLK